MSLTSQFDNHVLIEMEIPTVWGGSFAAKLLMPSELWEMYQFVHDHAISDDAPYGTVWISDNAKVLMSSSAGIRQKMSEPNDVTYWTGESAAKPYAITENDAPVYIPSMKMVVGEHAADKLLPDIVKRCRNKYIIGFIQDQLETLDGFRVLDFEGLELEVGSDPGMYAVTGKRQLDDGEQQQKKKKH